MGKKPEKYSKRIILGITFVMMLALFTTKPVLPGIGIIEPKGVSPPHERDRAVEPYKILAVLERENDGKALPEKVRDKIFSLNGEQTRLIISLCDRLTENGHTAGGDIAYLFITALIILS